MLSSCLESGGKFSDILPDTGTTESAPCIIDQFSPSETSVRIPNIGTASNIFSVTPSGTKCAVKYFLNDVELSGTSANLSILSSEFGSGSNVLRAVASNAAGTATKSWTVQKNTVPVCSFQFPAATGNSANVGQNLTLVGNGFDANSDSLTISWKINGSVPAAGVFAITNGTNSSSNIFSPSNIYSGGSSTITAEINDGYDTASCSWAVSVNSNCSIGSALPSSASVRVAALGTTSTQFTAVPSEAACAMSWTLNGTSLGSSSSAVSVLSSSLSVGNNTLVATASNGASTATRTWTVQKNVAPNCSSQNPGSTGNTMNSGATLNLSATAADADGDAVTFSWLSNSAPASPTYYVISGTGYNSAAAFTPNTSFVGANSISATFTDGYDVGSCNWAVTVSNTCSLISSSPSSATVRVSAIGGTSTSFGAVANESNCTISWTLNGVAVGSPGNFYSLLSSALNTGNNTLIATASNGGSSATRTWTVAKNSAPTCPTQIPAAGGNTLSHTSTVNFTANGTDADSDPLTFAWLFNSASNPALFDSITTTATQSIGVFNPGLGQVGTGHVVSATISDGIDTGVCAWSVDVTDPNTLNISSCTPDVSPAVAKVASIGPNVSLQVNATGTGLTYTWRKDGAIQVGSTTQTLTITPASIAVGDYVYAVEVTDAYSNTGSCQWNVTRNSPPSLASAAPDNSRAGADHVMTYGTTQLFSATASDLNAGDTLTYTWSISPAAPGTLPSVNANNNTFSPTFSNLGSYTVSLVVSDGTESSTATTWDVRVNAFSPKCNELLSGKPLSASPGTGVPVTGGRICTILGQNSAGDRVIVGSTPNSVKIQPRFVMDDGSGGMFIADALNHAIWYWNRTGSSVTRTGKVVGNDQFVVIAGNGTLGRNEESLESLTYPTVATAVAQGKLNNPHGLAYDSAGDKLWVSDWGNNRVVEVNNLGLITTRVGWNPSPSPAGVTPANNSAGNTDGALGTAAICTGPAGLWYDSTNSWLYIACNGSHAIKRMKTSGVDVGKVYMVVGRLSMGGVAYPCVTGVPPASITYPNATCATGASNVDGSLWISGTAGVNAPWDVKGDTDGNIYWTDNGGRRLRMATTAGAAKTFFLAGNIGATTLTASDVSSAPVGTITGLAVSTATPGATTKLLISGPPNAPVSACVPFVVYRADAANVAATSGAPITVTLSASSGSVFNTPDCSGGSASLVIGANQASGIGSLLTPASGTPTITAASAGLTSGTLSPPVAAAAAVGKVRVYGAAIVDPTLTCEPYIAILSDANDRVVASGINRPLVLTTARAGSTFYSDSSCSTVANGTAPSSTQAILNTTRSSVFYVNRTINVPANSVVSLAGDTTTNADAIGAIGVTTFNAPTGLALDITNDATPVFKGIYVATGQSRVIYLNLANSSPWSLGGMSFPLNSSAVFAGTGTAGFTGDNALANGRQINLPGGLWHRRGTTEVLIADHTNLRVRKVSLASGATEGQIDTIIGNGVNRSGWDSSQTEAPKVFMNAPSGLFTETSGSDSFLHFADSTNAVVRRLNLVTGIVGTSVGTGTAGNGSAGGTSPTLTPTRSPRAVVVLNNHLVYSDRNNSNCLVRAWNRAASGGASSFFGQSIAPNTVETLAGNFPLGCANWTAGMVTNQGSTNLATSMTLNNPEGLTTDGTSLYVADYSQGCIVKIGSDGKYYQWAGLCGTPAAATDGTAGSDLAPTSRIREPLQILIDPLFSVDGNMFIIDQHGQGSTSLRYLNFKTSSSPTIMGVAVNNAAGSGVGYLKTIITEGGTPRYTGVAAFDTQVCLASGDSTSGNVGFHNVRCYDRTMGSITLRIGAHETSTTSKGGAQMGTEQEGLSTLIGSDDNPYVKLGGPYSLAFDSSGNLYISERLTHTVRMVRRWW